MLSLHLDPERTTFGIIFSSFFYTTTWSKVKDRPASLTRIDVYVTDQLVKAHGFASNERLKQTEEQALRAPPVLVHRLPGLITQTG